MKLQPPHDLYCDDFDNEKQIEKQAISLKISVSPTDRYIDCLYSGMKIPIEDCIDIQSHSGDMFCCECPRKNKYIKNAWLIEELGKLNKAIYALKKLNPELSVVLSVKEYCDTMSTLEKSKVELCKKIGILHESD